jgi:hypothetical protein
MTLLGTQPWWYWLILVSLALVVVVAFAFFRWHIATEATKIMRRIDVIGERTVRRHEDLYWDVLRDVEARLAWLIAMERAVTEQPARVAALISEGVPLLDACEAVAS